MSGLLIVCATVLLFSCVLGEQDPACFHNCKCCIGELCHYQRWPNTCTIGCIDGHRGARCYEMCQYENCKSCGAGTLSTECDSCYDGYYIGLDKDCTSRCPSNCLSCISNTSCTACKRGFYYKNATDTCENSRCPLNCKCINNQTECISCKAGYYNKTSLCKSKCPVNCDTCTSYDTCESCINGFYSGYEYGSALGHQLNNCSFECRKTCTKCQSFNNCSQCVRGVYGLTCQNYCSVGCIDGLCLTESGNCNCSKNFTGDNCTECVFPKHGKFCNETCPEYCKGNVCDSISRDCIQGCISDTIVGRKCSICIKGIYGELCNKNCPVSCKEKTCERFSGICSNGCEVNFNGRYCDKCAPGKHGENCDLSCPEKCFENLCEKQSGDCFNCTDNFIGSKCDSCKPGFYGLTCVPKCSSHCRRGVCNRDNGVCVHGCAEGFSGDRCCVEGENCMNCSLNTECMTCVPGYFQHLCKERCPEGCEGSCEFSIGSCFGCKKNVFGTFCSFSCSKNCNTSGVSETSCAQSDGTCIYGCHTGYYGPFCDKECNSKCVGNACKQESGKCIHGCDGEYNAEECFAIVDSSSETSRSEDSRLYFTIGVFVSLFVLSLIFNLVQTLLFVKQRRFICQSDSRGQRQCETYYNQQATTNVAFSDIRQHDEEHTYQQL